MRPQKWDDFFRHGLKQRPSGCYALTGPETYLKGEAILRMRRALAGEDAEPGGQRYAVDTYRAGETSVRDIATLVSQAGLFGGERLVLVESIERLTRTGKSDREAWLALGASRPANLLVLISERTSRELSQRSKFLSSLLQKVQVVEFWPLRPADAKRWVLRSAAKRGTQIAPEVAEYLVDHLGTDLHLLIGEIEKISLMCGERRVSLADLRQLVHSGVLGSAWECAEAALRGDIHSALELLQGVRREESAFSFLWKLGHVTGNALRAQRGSSPPGGYPRSSSARGGPLAPTAADKRGSDQALAELLRGCYEWERRMKSGQWSGRHDFAALEGLLAGHAMLKQRPTRTGE